MRARERSSFSTRGAKKQGTTFWDERAAWFNQNTKGDTFEPEMLISKVNVTPDTTILDIGAGTGRFSVYLAPRARHVTAVDHSPEMLKYLRDNAAEAGVTNITTLQASVEELAINGNVKPHDIVIAAYSLDVNDMGDSLVKIDALAIEHAFIFTWVKRTFWDMENLWPLVHSGEKFVPCPGHDYIIKILNEMGIHPKLETFWKEKDKIFQSWDAALRDVKEFIGIEGNEKDALLLGYLKDHLAERGENIVHHGTTERVMLWWDKKR